LKARCSFFFNDTQRKHGHVPTSSIGIKIIPKHNTQVISNQIHVAVQVVVVGESTPIGEGVGEGEANSNQAGRPVYVAVASSTL
jgi:hypothetical protein